MSVEALKQALEALEGVLAITNDSEGVYGYHLNGAKAAWGDFEEIYAAEETITALRQAIEQAEKQKPVAYMDAVFTETVWVPPARKFWLKEHEDKAWCAFHAKHMDDIPLYIAPPHPKRIIFPTSLRKMWSGTDVQHWLDENANGEGYD